MASEQRICRTTFGVALLLLGGMATEAGEPAVGAKNERKGPLAGLPGAEGPNIEKIKALGDNEWLSLGSPAPDPKWGKARGRAWTFKMSFAPELRGAFLYGTGVHGYVKPDGHYQDDLFFYDINGHRWICCYPGLDLKPEAPDLKIDENGWERDASGQPIPVITGHGWGHVTYDTDRKMFVFAREHGTQYKALTDKRGKWWSADLVKTAKPHSPWAWNTLTEKWECEAIETPHPNYSNCDTLIYIPSKKKFFYAGASSRSAGIVHYYDPATKKWSEVKAKGPLPPASYDATSCLDAKQDRIYLGGGALKEKAKSNTLWIYDLNQDAWVDPQPTGTTLTAFSINISTMQFDSVNNVVVILAYDETRYANGERGIYIYNPGTNAWQPKLSLPPDFSSKVRVSAFYDPELNAHFFHAAGDSKDNGSMWVYRFKQAK